MISWPTLKDQGEQLKLCWLGAGRAVSGEHHPHLLKSEGGPVPALLPAQEAIVEVSSRVAAEGRGACGEQAGPA